MSKVPPRITGKLIRHHRTSEPAPTMATPRVLHVVPALFGDVMGGAERYALELARAMARRLPTTLLTFGQNGHRRQLGALDIVTLRNWIPFGRFTHNPLNP